MISGKNFVEAPGLDKHVKGPYKHPVKIGEEF